MVYPMLINTNENNFRVIYKQNISTNTIKNKNKTYSYKEVNIPVELLNYWQSITKEEIKTIAYVFSGQGGINRSFITPLTVKPEETINLLYNADISTLLNTPEKYTPDRIIPIQLRKRGKPDKPKFFIRLNNDDFITNMDSVDFVINPYLDDPILRVKGLVSVNLIMV